MSEMEQDAKDLLRKTLVTISVGSLWLIVNATIGLMYGWFFFDNKPSTGNLVFYAWFLLSLIALIWYCFRIWKSPESKS